MKREIPTAVLAAIGWMTQALATTLEASTPSPVQLVDHHVDLRMRYDPLGTNQLDVLAVDDDLQPPRAWAAEDCILVVPEASRLELPGEVPPLGLAGESVWILPASQQPGMLYLGLSAEGVPAGIFSDRLRLELLKVDGPGQFFLWQSDLGGLTFFMNTRDGIGAEEGFPQLAGGHSHANWGFTTSGVYRVTVRASGRRKGESTNVLGSPRTFTFHVLPLPSEPVSPFLRWQREHWPSGSDPTLAAENADPDADGRANLWEYVLGTDPRSPDLPGDRAPRIVVTSTDIARSVELRLRKRTTSVDVGFGVRWAESPQGPWNEQEVAWHSEADVDGWSPLWCVLPPVDVAVPRRFYRVEAYRIAAP